MDKRFYCEVAKVDDDLGLVFGWAIVCTEDGQPYFDLQGDHIPEDAMLKAATDFMLHSRRADTMHDMQESGTVLYTMPLTSEVKKAFGIECSKSGLMVAMKPNPTMHAKFRSGELKGFSIGGFRGEDEDLEEPA